MERCSKALASLKRVFKGCLKDTLWVPVKPVPASRPKVTRFGTHYSDTYERFRRDAGLALEKHWRDQPQEGPLAVITEIVCLKPQRTYRVFPRGDNDNFEKAAWDVITRAQAIWQDDDQIILNTTWKRYADKGEKPGIRVTSFLLELPVPA